LNLFPNGWVHSRFIAIRGAAPAMRTWWAC